MVRSSLTGTLIVVLLIPVSLAVLYLAFFGGSFPFFSEGVGKETLFIERVPIKVDIADTEEKRILGLGGRSFLPANQGMLFVFDSVASHGIWMKGMQFPIDIVWIGSNLRVVDIMENVQPDSFPRIFYPRANARYVLEVNALFVEARDIQKGDTITLPSSLSSPL